MSVSRTIAMSKVNTYQYCQYRMASNCHFPSKAVENYNTNVSQNVVKTFSTIYVRQEAQSTFSKSYRNELKTHYTSHNSNIKIGQNNQDFEETICLFVLQSTTIFGFDRRGTNEIKN